MNLIGERKWELYNFDNIGISSEYNNLLINKDIDNYFNDIISKPIHVPQYNSSIIKSNYNLNKFYLDYIEHNLLFIVVLVGIIIFLIIRHYGKDFDRFDSVNNIDNTNLNKPNKSNKFNKSNKSNKPNKQNDILKKTKKLYQEQNEKIKNKSKKLEIEKNKLINYKMELNREKQQILSIIDELSNINDYNKNNQIYLDQDINTLYSNNYNNQMKLNNQYNNQYNNIKTRAHNDNDNIDNTISFQDDNTSNYYDINKKQNDKMNEIDGLYIEPPFM